MPKGGLFEGFEWTDLSDLVVKERDTIQPTFYVRGDLPADFSGASGEPPSDEKGFRAMTPAVGAEGLEPPTCWL